MHGLIMSWITFMWQTQKLATTQSLIALFMWTTRVSRLVTSNISLRWKLYMKQSMIQLHLSLSRDVFKSMETNHTSASSQSTCSHTLSHQCLSSNLDMTHSKFQTSCSQCVPLLLSVQRITCKSYTSTTRTSRPALENWWSWSLTQQCGLPRVPSTVTSREAMTR